MALSLMLRNSIRPQGLQSLFKNSPIVFNNSAKFTQLSANNLKLAEKCGRYSKTGTITAVPKRMTHDHSFMWTVEKGVSASLLAVVPLGLIYPNFLLDNIMAVLICAHSHWGIEAVVLDYVRPIIFGSAIPKIAFLCVYVLSALTLGGLLYFNFTNIGIGKGVQRLWNGKQ